MPEPPLRSALELAELVRSGELSATEAAEDALARIDERSDALGAFVHVAREDALREAGKIGPGDPRPFAGVPTAVKDLAPVAGMPLELGSELMRGFAAPLDSYAVRRMRDAGFVILGKTTTAEFGVQPVAEPRTAPPARNPWDPRRTAGGSSGGSAVAVAAGMVPVAHGNDGGGSVRTPAACCGLVGLKPARGRISLGPLAGESFLATDGVIARTVADAAAWLDALAGYEPGDASWAPAPPESFAAAAARDPDRLRVLATHDPIWEARPDAESLASLRSAAELVEALGHEVIEDDPPWHGEDLWATFSGLWAPGIAAGVTAAAAVANRDVDASKLEPLTAALYHRGRSTPAPEFTAALGAAQLAARGIVAALQPFDAVLTPALGARPPAIGGLEDEDPWVQFRNGARFNPYSPLWNVTGQPAVTLPLAMGRDGMPLGIQLAGRPAGEGALLALAAQLEQVTPWTGGAGPA